MQLEPIEQWIWLPAGDYPNNTTTISSSMYGDAENDGHYSVVRLEKKYNLGKAVKSVHIRTSGDTFFRLYVNGEYRISGPASVGGDFLSNERVRPQHYANEFVLDSDYQGLSEGVIEFSAVVRMLPLRMFE